MNEYTASNGVLIEDRGGSLHANGSLIIGAGSTFRAALAEFFRAEEDNRLGRFRHGEYVVYPGWRDSDATRRVFTIWEKNGRRDVVSEDEIPNTVFGAAARAYFDAHPDPKPWRDANAGEVWVLTCDNGILGGAYLAGDHSFIAADHGLPIESDRITSGRRIWPES